ncbi:1-acyl-sn-glycerol-3-phosphate acyltransferase [unidentified eubacterium SCB49]|nr:1-acyl-sn-glycerol-3-phosphate acyltransferase [unidentified eubacterium SCB49]
MSPLLIISVMREEWYPFFFKMARVWAIFILIGMGFKPKKRGEKTWKKGESYLFVSNHTSMTDIMLMLYMVKNPFVFVGKAELAKLPIFGYFYKRTCILVDRSNMKSRRAVFDSAQQKINQGLSVCIFPEGGVPDDTSIILDNFKDGAFRLAIDHQIPIAPLTFHDNKKRLPFNIFKGSPGLMRVKLHPIIATKNLVADDKKSLREQTRNVLLQELEQPSL